MAYASIARYEPREELLYDEYDGIEIEKEISGTPMERMYFTGEMLAKYEPCTQALKAIIDSKGEDEEQWDAFEEHFEKFMNCSWNSTWDGKKYDIVFYGVSGYTGYLMMQYLKRVSTKRNPEPFTFAFAGRTPSKVAELRDREFIGTEFEDTPILQASYDDITSVIDMCKSAHVIINVAGPYMLAKGEVLIDACCHMGTHYADVAGEVPWTLRSLDLDNHAKEGGAIITPSAAVAGGYPDLLTYICAKAIREKYGEECRRSLVFATGGGAAGGASGGTLATRAAMSSASDNIRKAMADPFALGGFIPDIDRNGFKEVTIQQGTGKVNPKIRKEDADSVLAKITTCPYTGELRLPWVYTYFDNRMVRRSNALFADLMGQPYGKDFVFMEFGKLPPEHKKYMAQVAQGEAPPPEPGQAPKGPSVAGEQAALEAQGKYFKQGDGPPLEELSDCWVCFECHAESPSGASFRIGIIGNDGYFETARCAVEFAMACRFDYDKFPIKGGHLTATVAAQQCYFDRLLQSGLTCSVGKWFDDHEYKAPPY